MCPEPNAAALPLYSSAPHITIEVRPPSAELGATPLYRHGSRRVTPQYETFIVAHQRPGDDFGSTLQAEFPMRPILLLGAEELDRATVQVDVIEPTPFRGGILDGDGGTVATGPVRVVALAGDLLGPQAV